MATVKRKKIATRKSKFLIEIQNQQKCIHIVPTRILDITQQILSLLNVRAASLSLVFVTDRKIKALNRAFLKRDHTTDVLAFDLSDDALSYSGKRKISYLEGEVVISATTTARNADYFGNKPFDELVLCIVHGILHLLGYDDHDPKEKKRMRKKQDEIVNLLNDK